MENKDKFLKEFDEECSESLDINEYKTQEEDR